MRLTRRAALALPAAFALGGRARADVPNVPAAVATASLDEPPDTEEAIEERMQDWIEKSGLRARDGKSIAVTYKTSAVLVPSSNPDWVRARMMAYADALIEAQADIVAREMLSSFSTTVKDFIKGPDAPPPYKEVRTPGQAADAIRKLVGAANGALDDRLRGMGIDPKQYEQAPEPQKTVLLTNAIKTRTVQHAFGSLAGTTPVMTFEGHDGQQQHQIGVVAVSSPLIADFARQVLTARGQFTPEPARAQDLSRLYQDRGQLLQDFGVRRLFDDQGLPAIVSFAQWASVYRGNDGAAAASYRDAARRQAAMFADAQLSDFLTGSISVEAEASAGQTQARIAATLPDSVTEEDTKRIVDEMRRSLRGSSRMQIVGLRTLRTWTGRHPASAIPIVGVIRIWSAASEQGMRALKEQPVASPAATAAPPRGSPTVTQSRSLMDSSDF